MPTQCENSGVRGKVCEKKQHEKVFSEGCAYWSPLYEIPLGSVLSSMNDLPIFTQFHNI